MVLAMTSDHFDDALELLRGGDLARAAGVLLESTLLRSAVARRPRGDTLQTTEVYHEAYLRLMTSLGRIDSRAALITCCSRVIPRVLIDHARRRGARRRTPQGDRLDLEEMTAGSNDESGDIEWLQGALERLEKAKPAAHRVISLSLCNLTNDKIADHLGVSTKAIEKQKTLGYAYLRWMGGGRV